MNCIKCSKSIDPHKGSMVMLDDALWIIVARNAGIKKSDSMCADCIELAMGRKIKESDFMSPQIRHVKIIPCNAMFIDKRKIKS